MRMIDMEIRPDWREIVLAVPCPRCGAPVGEMCTSIGMATPLTRPDYHAERKNQAKSNYESGIHGGEQGEIGHASDDSGSYGHGIGAGANDLQRTPDHSPDPVLLPADRPVQADAGGTEGSVEGSHAPDSGDSGTAE